MLSNERVGGFTLRLEKLYMSVIVHLPHRIYPVNTKHLYSICTMLDQRRRRWADVVQMLYKCFVFARIHQRIYLPFSHYAATILVAKQWRKTNSRIYPTTRQRIQQQNIQQQWRRTFTRPSVSFRIYASRQHTNVNDCDQMKWNESGFRPLLCTYGLNWAWRMVRWLWWHCPPDTGFEIRAPAVWGRTRYLSVTEAPHNTDWMWDQL